MIPCILALLASGLSMYLFHILINWLVDLSMGEVNRKADETMKALRFYRRSQDHTD